MNRVASSIAMLSVSAVIAWAIVAPAGQFSFLAGAVAAPTLAATSVIMIDRSLKGDRLAPAVQPIRQQSDTGARNSVAPKAIDAKMLDGCEPAASPIASPELAHIIGSCVS
jgi:hypothetical protein